jgi:hypothetical protein
MITQYKVPLFFKEEKGRLQVKRYIKKQMDAIFPEIPLHTPLRKGDRKDYY